MGIAIAVMTANIVAFFVGGGLLHWCYYVRRRSEPHAWKYQPTRFQGIGAMRKKLPLVLVNAVIINLAIGFAVSLVVREQYGAFWDPRAHHPAWVIGSSVGIFLWYHGLLYYWHRTMHRPWLFRRFHHLHHRSKNPIWLDALYEHPLEAAWGAVVIVSPVLLFPLWTPAFLAFIAIMGLHEVFDHAGIRIDVPVSFLSTSKAHDDHHRRCHCYYGQLLPLLDHIHETGDERLPAHERVQS
jgi:Delta7-sterol 5-desaturase